MTYLIVDDSAVSRKSLSGYLKEKGHFCKTACNAIVALTILDKETFDIVITDFKMRGMNGIDLLKIIRQKYSNTRVIIITGYAEVENAVDALNYGANGFLQKPLDMHKLDKILKEAESDRFINKTNYASLNLGIYEKMAYQKNWHDIPVSMNGLVNRRRFLERLESEMQGKEMLALIKLNLENFDFLINSLGFKAGNKLIIETVYRIKGCIKTKDILCQIRNDSFAIIFSRINSSEEVVEWTKQLLQVLKKPVSFQEREFFVKAVIGIAVYPHHGKEPENLLKNSNVALQYAKKKGKENIQLYSPDINREN